VVHNGIKEAGMKKELVEAVVSATWKEEGRAKLSCAQAFKLANKFKVKPADIGKICNQQKIKLCACQLGCFQ
jgi:hypothetical protein